MATATAKGPRPEPEPEPEAGVSTRKRGFTGTRLREKTKRRTNGSEQGSNDNKTGNVMDRSEGSATCRAVSP